MVVRQHLTPHNLGGGIVEVQARGTAPAERERSPHEHHRPPRTKAKIAKFVLLAAGELDAAAKNARTNEERDHATRGWNLCREAWNRLG